MCFLFYFMFFLLLFYWETKKGSKVGIKSKMSLQTLSPCCFLVIGNGGDFWFGVRQIDFVVFSFFSFLIFIFRSLVLGFFNIILENFHWGTRSLNGKKCGREESGCPRVAGLQKVEAKIVEISTCLIVVSCQCGKVHFSKAIH